MIVVSNNGQLITDTIEIYSDGSMTQINTSMIYVTNGATNSKFYELNSVGYGIIGFVGNSEVYLDECNFTNIEINTTISSGGDIETGAGVIYVDNGSKFGINNCGFESISAFGNGSAIYSGNGSIYNCVFKNCDAANNGGDMYFSRGAGDNVNISHCVSINATAGNKGNLIYITSSNDTTGQIGDIMIEHSSFDGLNSVDSAIYLEDGPVVTVSNITATNTSYLELIEADCASVEIASTYFESNIFSHSQFINVDSFGDFILSDGVLANNSGTLLDVKLTTGSAVVSDTKISDHNSNTGNATISQEIANSFIYVFNQTNNDSVTVNDSTINSGTSDYFTYLNSPLDGHELAFEFEFDYNKVMNVSKVAITFMSSSNDSTRLHFDANDNYVETVAFYSSFGTNTVDSCSNEIHFDGNEFAKFDMNNNGNEYPYVIEINTDGRKVNGYFSDNDKWEKFKCFELYWNKWTD